MTDPKNEQTTAAESELETEVESNQLLDENDAVSASSLFDTPAESESESEAVADDEPIQIDSENESLDDTAVTETEEQVEETDDIDAADPAAHDDVILENPEEDDDGEPETEQGDPYGGHKPETLKNILEAAIFSSGTTLSVSHLRALFENYERPHGKTVRQLMAELIAHYEGRGMQLVEVASGYRFQTDPDTSGWVSRLWDEKPQRYSRALMETIALIAYRQPITRGEIEDVRGVAVSSNIIRTLLEREWVRVVGHRDVPGRPAMYATTKQFLDYFSLNSLDQMPSLSEIRDLEELNPQMELGTDEKEAGEEDQEQSEMSSRQHCRSF